MSSKIASVLGLSEKEPDSTEHLVTKLQSLTEWLTESIESTKDTPLFEFFGRAGEAAKEWSGTIRTVEKLVENFTRERSPQVLGWLAATVAYRKAAEETVRNFGRPAIRIPYSQQITVEQLRRFRLEDPSIFEGFALDTAAGHPFVQAADQAFILILEAGGYDPAERRRMLRTIRTSFKGAMQEVLSEQRDRFGSFIQWLELDTDDRRLDATLLSYADLQRVELEDRPALGIEPFAIADVYIDSECGVLLSRFSVKWRAGVLR